jgi:hypothetical protein
MTTYTIPVDGLGMEEKDMLELVNRLNKHTPFKWKLLRGYYSQLGNNIPNPYYQNIPNQLATNQYLQ